MIKPARHEVASKSDRQIERETARKWAARALACFERAEAVEGWDEAEHLKWLLRAEDYKNEALEHAALAKDRGRTLVAIEREFDRRARKSRRSR